MFERIAVIKTGWSEDYRGVDEVRGNYAYALADHEKVNFLPGPDGRFFCYVPPTGGNLATRDFGGPPKPKVRNGWLVFAVSRKPNKSGLYVVGWYEDASFVHAYLPRPEYESGTPWFGAGADGNPVGYVFSAPRAVAIDGPDRDMRLSGDRFKRHILYLRGNNSPEDWRDDWAKQLLDYRDRHVGGAAFVTPEYVSPEEGAQFKYGPGGEGPHHKALREWVMRNPAVVAPAFAQAEQHTEYPLLSGDRVDCAYILPECVAMIEVKSWRSNSDDVLRGIYQCIKYRSVYAAMQIERPVPVEAILVTQKPLTDEHRRLLERHDIRHFQAPKDLLPQ